MQLLQIPASPIRGLRTIELGVEHEPLLQRFFEENPLYFQATHGSQPGPEAARNEIHSRPPGEFPFAHRWLIGYLDDTESVRAVAEVVADFLAAGVWHIGLFVVATDRHGTGDAQQLYRGLEDWAIASGARWLRLGVVEGNVRAERFWASAGYVQTRTREGNSSGIADKTIRVMVKPLADGAIEEYLALMPRDRSAP